MELTINKEQRPALSELPLVKGNNSEIQDWQQGLQGRLPSKAILHNVTCRRVRTDSRAVTQVSSPQIVSTSPRTNTTLQLKFLPWWKRTSTWRRSTATMNSDNVRDSNLKAELWTRRLQGRQATTAEEEGEQWLRLHWNSGSRGTHVAKL